MTVLLLMCQIWAGDLTNCVPPRAYSGHLYSQPRYQIVQKDWTTCMAESDRRNSIINERARKMMWPNYWQYFCKAIEAVPA